jgi:hypothetical protein
MVDIVAAAGTTVTVPDEAINVVSGPYPSDSGTKSYVRGNFGPGALESKEDASHLVGRLQVTLAMLTRPNGAPVWVKTRAIAMLRYPLDTEIQGPPNLVWRLPSGATRGHGHCTTNHVAKRSRIASNIISPDQRSERIFKRILCQSDKVCKERFGKGL